MLTYIHTYALLFYIVPEALQKHVYEVSSTIQHQPHHSSTNQQRIRQLQYSPPIHVDEIGLTSDKYIPINNTIYTLSLKLSYASMSLQRWLLMSQLESSLSDQKSMVIITYDCIVLYTTVYSTIIPIVLCIYHTVCNIVYNVCVFQYIV